MAHSHQRGLDIFYQIHKPDLGRSQRRWGLSVGSQNPILFHTGGQCLSSPLEDSPGLCPLTSSYLLVLLSPAPTPVLGELTPLCRTQTMPWLHGATLSLCYSCFSGKWISPCRLEQMDTNVPLLISLTLKAEADWSQVLGENNIYHFLHEEFVIKPMTPTTLTQILFLDE